MVGRGVAGVTADARPFIDQCRERGFALAGVARLARSAHEDAWRAWVREGRHATMQWLARTLEDRIDPCRGSVLEGAKAAIVVADRYASRGAEDEGETPGRGRVARYARGEDYHDVMKARLHALADAWRAAHPGEAFRVFVDSAPVPERELAARAGLGWIGKHTLLIHPRLGSWLVLGGALTTLDIEPAGERVADHCGSCTRCIDACPTGAIVPYGVDARRCVSYITIERRSVGDDAHAVEPDLIRGVGSWIFGCDVCQEVCPHNSARPGPDEPAPFAALAPRLASLDVREVGRWTGEDRARALKGSAMKRATLAMLQRNAAVVAQNQGLDAGPERGQGQREA